MQQQTNLARSAVRRVQLRNRACVLAVVCLLVGPSIARAQTCVGLPGPEGGVVQLGAGYMSQSGTSQISVYAGGVGSLVFGQLYTSTINYDGFRGYGQTNGASLGLRLLKRAAGTFELCPVVAGGFGGITSEVSGRAERIVTTRDVGIGASLGYRIDVNKSYAVIPSARASFERASFSQTDPDFSSSVNYGVLRLSTGLVMGTRFTAYPSLTVPFGIQGGRHTWGLAFTRSLKQRKP